MYIYYKDAFENEKNYKIFFIKQKTYYFVIYKEKWKIWRATAKIVEKGFKHPKKPSQK